jgi:hypothetical protein
MSPGYSRRESCFLLSTEDRCSDGSLNRYVGSGDTRRAAGRARPVQAGAQGRADASGHQGRAAHLATKRDLELWGGALLARIESNEQRLEQRLIERIDGTEQRLSAELARHVGAIHESMVAWFAASDEKYADLPGRMKRVEAAVFAPKQR